jgi:hypothetical protein
MDPDLRRDDYWIPTFGGMTTIQLRVYFGYDAQ